jgi:polar amino acid transport system ATP-binding protein
VTGETNDRAVGVSVPVRLEGVHKSFGDNHVLRGIDLNVATGEVLTIIGPSGSGKSTLLRCVNLLEPLNEGKVFFEGQEITRKGADVSAVRQQIGMVFQQFNLFPHLTVMNNLTLATRRIKHRPRAEAEQRARVLLERVGLSEKADQHPHQLSGGQQQRVAAARALASRPQIVFADEPTGALDSKSGSELLGFLRKAVKELGQTVVMVTHDPVAASYADRVIFLADGKIVDEMSDPTADSVLDSMKRLGA